MWGDSESASKNTPIRDIEKFSELLYKNILKNLGERFSETAEDHSGNNSVREDKVHEKLCRSDISLSLFDILEMESHPFILITQGNAVLPQRSN